MGKLLCVYENMIATVATMRDYYEQLEMFDNRISVEFMPAIRVTPDVLSKVDVLMCIRPNNAYFARIAKLARSMGITVLMFLDDDLGNLPQNHPDMPWRKKGLLQTARESDVIVSCNRHLLEKYSHLSGVGRTVRIDTAVPRESIVGHQEDVNDRLKIVYAAGIAHIRLFDLYIKPIIGQIDALYGQHISLTFMGVHPKLDTSAYTMPIRYIPPLSLEEYRRTIAEGNYDIGLAPLEQTEFSRCKYFNKYIEYAMFGIVGVYSNVEPYTFVIRDKHNGLLADNNAEAWQKALSEAIENAALIHSCRSNIRDNLLDQFDFETIANKTITEIPELVKPHVDRRASGGTLAAAKALYRASRVGDWAYKSLFYLKNGGLSELLYRAKRHWEIVKSTRNKN